MLSAWRDLTCPGSRSAATTAAAAPIEWPMRSAGSPSNTSGQPLFPVLNACSTAEAESGQVYDAGAESRRHFGPRICVDR